MKIAISGYYGFKNLGDEAILLALKQGIREVLPEAQVEVLDAGHRFNLKMIWDCDILISGGGGLLQDKTSTRSFLYYISVIKLAKLLGKKVYIFAQGLGPITRSYNLFLLKRILNQVDLITVRDLHSFNLIKSWKLKNPKIVETADPTFLLKAPPCEKLLELEGISKDKPKIGVCLRKSKATKRMAWACDQLAKKLDAQIIFVPFQTPQDLFASREVMGKMKEKSFVIFRELKPQEVLGVISCLDLLIGMRLHSLMFAVSGLVPAVGLSYDPKVEAFMEEVGLPCLNIEQLDADQLVSAVMQLWDNREGVVNSLKHAKRKLYSKAQLNFGMINMLKGDK